MSTSKIGFNSKNVSMDPKIHTKMLFDYRLGLMWRTLPAAVRETYNMRALEVADEHKRKNPCKLLQYCDILKT
jgi:hypothetical protein